MEIGGRFIRRLVLSLLVITVASCCTMYLVTSYRGGLPGSSRRQGGDLRGLVQVEDGVVHNPAAGDSAPRSSTTKPATPRRKGPQVATTPRTTTTTFADAQRKPLMIAAITGGRGDHVEANRAAIIDTFATQTDLFFVTLDNVNTPNVIRLPKEAETGGRAALPKKILHMWDHIYHTYGNRYDFFMKIDDDTFVNVPRLVRNLELINPNVPACYGGKRYSAYAPVDGPTRLWRRMGHAMIAHGGAGYIYSRALLDMIGPKVMSGCWGKEPRVGLEDAKMTGCIYKHTGVTCIAMHDVEYGGFDAIRNSHRQDVASAAIKVHMEDPFHMATLTTFHSVQSHLMRSLFKTTTFLNGNVNVTETVTEKIGWAIIDNLQDLTSDWHCLSKGPDNTTIQAVCQQSVILAAAPRILPDDWHPVSSLVFISSNKSDIVVRAKTQPQDYLSGMIDVPEGLSDFPKYSPPLTRPPPGRNVGADSSKRNIVLVAEDKWPAFKREILSVLMSSLRSAGCTADVYVLTEEDKPTETALKGLADRFGGMHIVSYAKEIDKDVSEYARDRFENDADYALLGAVTRFLNNFGQGFNRVLKVPVDTIFQRDPFSEVDLGDQKGVTVFIDGKNSMATLPCSANANTEKMNADMIAKWKKFQTFPRMELRPVMEQVVLGDIISVFTYHKVLLTATVSPDDHKIYPGCHVHNMVQIGVYKRLFAVQFPVRILAPWGGWVANLAGNSSLWGLVERSGNGNLLVTNDRGIPVAFAIGWAGIGSAVRNGAAIGVPKGTAEVALERQTVFLQQQREAASSSGIMAEEVFKGGSEFDPLRLEWADWRPGEKAHTRFTTLMATADDPNPAMFKPLREHLDRFSVYDHNRSLPKVVKVATLKTHKTGSSTLSSVFFRFCARHARRMFARGDWTTLPAKFLQEPYEEETAVHDMTFYHLSTHGQWDGKWEQALRFYSHLLGPEYKLVTVFRDPVMQYISWTYYFLVPERPPGTTPMDYLREMVEAGKNPNLLAHEFGIRTEEELQVFMTRFFDGFDLIIPSERFDEGLILMKRLFNWDLLDITYIRLLDSHASSGSKRWDGRLLVPTPKMEAIPDDLIGKIRELTQLDQRLYDRAMVKFNDMLSAQTSSQPLFNDEYSAFLQIQDVLARTCKENSRQAICLWYAQDDLQFFRLISSTGYSPAVQI